nr:MAG TPA: hypothetical protein [Caudoviricetes sp.]
MYLFVSALCLYVIRTGKRKPPAGKVPAGGKATEENK